MVYYGKVSVSNPRDKVLALFQSNGILPEQVNLDYSTAPKAPGSPWQTLKEELLGSREPLTVDSIVSLGKNNREIYKELKWFKDNHLPLRILSIPSSHCGSEQALAVLCDVYGQLAEVEIQNSKRQQKPGEAGVSGYNKPLGRSKIPYPPNWDKVYASWRGGEITATEAMSLTGLKRGTFYNLAKRYQEQGQQAEQPSQQEKQMAAD